MTASVRALEPTDTPAARALLAGSDLPIDDLDDAAITLIGAFDGSTMIGIVGLQVCGSLGLLRSLAVSPAHRERGLGAVLCARVFALAAERSLASLWLLTTSARDFFTRHAFEVVARDEVPEAIRATTQFSSLCPSSAHVMRRR
jgi:amino-acid N-acetyltransferase